MSSFATLLRATRERAGLTQQELARTIGVDHSYISRIERGTSAPPTRDKVVAIADALGITDKTERALFLLAAGSAHLDDLEGFILVDEASGKEQGLAQPSFPTEGEETDVTEWQGGFVFASPLRTPRRRQNEENQLRELLARVNELRTMIETIIAEQEQDDGKPE